MVIFPRWLCSGIMVCRPTEELAGTAGRMKASAIVVNMDCTPLQGTARRASPIRGGQKSNRGVENRGFPLAQTPRVFALPWGPRGSMQPKQKAPCCHCSLRTSSGLLGADMTTCKHVYQELVRYLEGDGSPSAAARSCAVFRSSPLPSTSCNVLKLTPVPLRPQSLPGEEAADAENQSAVLAGTRECR